MSLHYSSPYGRPEFQAYIQNRNVRRNICGSLPHMQYNNIGASYARYGYPVNCMYPQDQEINKSQDSTTCHRVQNQGHHNVDYGQIVPNIENVLRAQVQDYITMGLEKQVTEISITKESTKILKNWMKLHRNNPYPSKTEKVMLAYSTRMTMTQISNWFANARRRIKQQKSSEIFNDSVLELSNGKKSAQILNSSAKSPQILDSSAKSSKILDSSTNSTQILDSSANLQQIPYSSANISHLLNSSANSGQITEGHNDTFLDHDMTCGSLQNSLNEPHITPDSGLESFTELDHSTQREDGIKNENKELKCKTNLFGTDPVSDITVEPLEYSVKTSEKSKTKIWSITDILDSK